MRVWWLLLVVIMLVVGAQSAVAQVELPVPSNYEKIVVSADSASRWTEGVYDVWLLTGDCRVNQGTTDARSQEAVLWVERGEPGVRPDKVIAYLEGKVEVDYADRQAAGSDEPRSAKVQDKKWLGRFYSEWAPDFRIGRVEGEPDVKPPVYRNALQQRDPLKQGVVQRTQFAEFGSTTPAVPQPAAVTTGQRRISIGGLGSVVRPNVIFERDEARQQSMVTITGGVNVVIDDPSGLLDISADNVVIWYAGTDLNVGTNIQPEEQPLEIYLEKNIVFRQGERTIEADTMYYDVRRRVGTVLNAEITTPAEGFDGRIKLRAAAIQQLDRSRFAARDASLTTSRLGVPTYDIRSGSLLFEDNQLPLVDPVTGAPAIDPLTGRPRTTSQQRVSAENNFIYVENIPVFYWPVLSTNLQEPNVYIDRIQFKNDGVFGTQVLTDFNAYQLLGIENPPDGTEWNLSLDYLSKRGPAAGTNFSYDRDVVYGDPGRMFGELDAWFIYDEGLDTLGRDRMDLVPEEEFRGRLRGQHKQPLPNGWTLQAELGYTTDRNFMEQFFEQEWDEEKDLTTGLALSRLMDNSSWTINANANLNDDFLDTQWLPRTDLFTIGQPVLNDALTWHQHTHIGYAIQNRADAPEDPLDAAKFRFLPYETDAEGERVATRQEIDYPFDLGIVKVVPFALGEVAHWGEALDEEDTQRAYGQVGIRASLPMWSVDPTIENQLFNVHGLAHKIVYEIQFEHSESNRNLDELVLYDEIDDNNIQQFRRRYPFDVFGGPDVPSRFDERYFGVRSGLHGAVTGPTEIADDLTALRMGVRQRWQTKRGLPGQRKIVDWITLDTQGVIFDAEDNFGESVGLLSYDFTWHVGDRTTLVSSGEADVFNEGQRTFAIGGFLTRPPRGNIFLGFRSLEGPISSNVISASYIYRMSPKWISTFGTSFDLSDENIGQHFELSRLGESFIVSLNANVDAGRDNFGIGLNVEPRFFARSRLQRGGFQIPSAGAFGLE